MSNKLENWIKARFADEKQVMNVLQEYGIISDNCISAREVGNDSYAMRWLAHNPLLIPKNESTNTW